MKTRILKLINNERTNVRIASKKGNGICDKGAVDVYFGGPNLAWCSTYAYDECNKDYGACWDGADDICNVDNNSPCHGAGARDITY